ncbi:hypothetical protein IE4872_PD01441 (plasmid) [Rhizobium gallicum]|uniref:Uncharacterized protein n=1 Tax=Rhizobium gallicum TaxID=56730 RepID=A0A1L5NVL6_9HYPH|nr:hypothetical protein IE4872_PD01441 [Rhizobium gallicum]
MWRQVAVVGVEGGLVSRSPGRTWLRLSRRLFRLNGSRRNAIEILPTARFGPAVVKSYGGGFRLARWQEA